MNILKLARHLKEFTLDEIEMIAECDCKTELEQLLNKGKSVFEQGLYKYKEPKQKQTFEFIAKPKIYKNKKFDIKRAGFMRPASDFIYIQLSNSRFP